jgi:hypothetical protein
MKYYCIGHKPPTFLPSEPYIHVSPNIYPGLNQLIVPDDSYGEKFDGRILSEYTQLFGLAEYLKDAPRDEKFYIFQYRKFISLRQPTTLSANLPHAYACSSTESPFFLPSQDELSRLGDELLLGKIIGNIGSIAEFYAANHDVNDFSAFMISLYFAGGLDEQRCKNFINYQILLPAPSLGVFRVDIFLKHMEVLKMVWTHFAEHFFVPRDGYQRRVGGFLLERLHSFLICEEVINKIYIVAHGNQVVVSDSLEIENNSES